MIFLQTASARVTDWLVRGGSISQEGREVYEFGLNKLFSTLVSFLFAVFMGLCLGVPLAALIFFAVYYFLRIYAGGYHADSQLKCFFISIGIMIPALLLIRFQELWYTQTVFLTALAAGTMILFLLCPVENKNKIPDALERRVYRCRLLRNLAIILLATIALFIFSYHEYSVAALCGVLLGAAMAVAGKIKLIFDKDE